MAEAPRSDPEGAGRNLASLKRGAAWALAIAALAFVVHAVPFRDHGDQPGLISTLAGARLGLLTALLALYFAGTLAWAARYRALLGLARVRVGILEAWRITLQAQAGGILLPGGIGGDALRVAFVVGKGANLTTVIAAVLLDRAIGLATLAGLASAMAAFFGGGELAATTVLLGAIPVALVSGLAVARFAPLSRFRWPGAGAFARIVGPVLDYLGDPDAPRAVARGAVFSLFVSATQLAVIRGIVGALCGAPHEERWVYVGTTMAFLVAALPTLPGAWGTSDAAFVFFLGKAGLAAPAALGVGLVYRLFWYSSGGVGAILYLLRQHAPTPPAALSPRSGTNAEPRDSEAAQDSPRTP